MALLVRDVGIHTHLEGMQLNGSCRKGSSADLAAIPARTDLNDAFQYSLSWICTLFSASAPLRRRHQRVCVLTHNDYPDLLLNAVSGFATPAIDEARLLPRSDSRKVAPDTVLPRQHSVWVLAVFPYPTICSDGASAARLDEEP